MFFVAGITGHVGGATARRLLEEGEAVRTLARDPAKAAAWAKQGVEVRQGDFNDAGALGSALEGVEGAYLMMAPTMAPAPGYPEAKANLASFLEALRQTPPPRLVALSSVGSEQGSGLGNIMATHMMEEALGEVSIPVAFVRAGGFFENYTHSMQVAAASGVLYSFYQPTDRGVPMIATQDIGHLVAKLLMEGWSGRKIVELGTRVSPDEIANAMGEALGREVRAQAVPRERWAATLEGFGLAAGTTAPYEEMMAGFNAGWIDFGVAGTEAVAGTMQPAEFFKGLLPA